MFVHFLSEEFQNYAAIGGDTVRIAERLPDLSCTFDMQGALGDILAPGHLRSGANVTIRASNDRMLRPKTSGDRRILTDGTFVGNCQFRVVRTQGKANAVIENDQTVVLAVPIPLRQPRWITIDHATGEFRVGPASRNAPAEAARFKLQYVPELATMSSHSSNPVSGFGVALTAPNQGQGQLRYDIALDRDALSPAGTAIAVFFEIRPAGARLSLSPIGGDSNPTSAGAIDVVVPPGQRDASFFVIGLDRPNPCLIFDNLPKISTNAPPMVNGKVRAKARAVHGFPTFDDDGHFPIENLREQEFTGVAVHSHLEITVNDRPLRNRFGLSDFDDPVERYGAIHEIRTRPEGLKLRIASARPGLLAAQTRFILNLTPRYIDRDDFPLLDTSAGPAIAPGNAATFQTDAQGRFSLDFQLTGFSVEKAQMMCVRLDLQQVGTGKLFTDSFAIEVQP
jgi:hypothetical protein